MPFERRDKKTIRTLVNLTDFDILWPRQVFPLFCMLDKKLFWDVTDRIQTCFLLRTTVTCFTVLMIDELQRLLSVILQHKSRALFFDHTLVLRKYHSRRSE